MQHMMIDLETMSTAPNAAVAALGIAVFDRENILNISHFTVNVASCLLAGAHVDDGTVQWWRGQSSEAKDAISHGGLHYRRAMNQLRSKWLEYGCERVWSHGSNFDVAICEFYGEMPWSYRQVRDTRTLFEIAQGMGWKRPEGQGIAHVASTDAANQAKAVISAWEWIS